MTHKEKINRLKAHLKKEGVSAWDFWTYVDGPIWKLFWLLGLKSLPPPLFLSKTQLTLINGTYFAIFWGLFMWFFVWTSPGLPKIMVIITSVAAGYIYGKFMAKIVKNKANELDLPSWDKYPNK